MRKITAGELSKILKEHKRWIDDKEEGEKADLTDADLSDADLRKANLSHADMRGADLVGADLRYVNLNGVWLSNANLSRADLGFANLECANLWEANLSEANLHGAKLYGANLSFANLSYANLKGANLIGVNLEDANLSKADLSGAYLNEADLITADLSNANLSRADLRGANLRRASLRKANLSCANLIRVRGLIIEQLSSVGTLRDAVLSSERIKQVRKKYPHLLGEIELDGEELSKSKIITLRSSYKTLSVSEVQSMPNVSIREKYDYGFYGYSTINHDYNIKTIKGDKVVVDNATGLMWHQGGPDNYTTGYKAKEWVEDLNSKGYAGYYDWRLPTVDEAVSLLESSKRNGLYIDPVFSKKPSWTWTGDESQACSGAPWNDAAWSVGFELGAVGGYHFCYNAVARPVRSVE